MFMSFAHAFSAAEQELCLNIIPTFANLIDYPSMKNALIPRIKSACLQTSSLAVGLLSDCAVTHCFGTNNFVSACFLALP